jgi:hypothetical protein
MLSLVLQRAGAEASNALVRQIVSIPFASYGVTGLKAGRGPRTLGSEATRDKGKEAASSLTASSETFRNSLLFCSESLRPHAQS